MDFLHTTSTSDLGVFALGLVIAGAVGGLAAGVFGIGGGIVIVPVLYHVMAALGVDASARMHVAIGTSLAAMIPAALAAAQNAKSGIEWSLLTRRIGPMLIGVGLGSFAAASANGRVLALAFAVVALAVVLSLMIGGRSGFAQRPSGRFVAPALTVSTGFASALSGIGAKTIGASLMNLLGVPMALSGATTAVLACVAAVVAATGATIAGWNAPDLPPYSLGYVNLLGFALIAPVLLATQPAGAALAHMLDLKRLRLVFTLLIVITTARMLWDALA